VLNEAHARSLLSTFQCRYNHHRPHQSRKQLPPRRRPTARHHSRPNPQTATDPRPRRLDQRVSVRRLKCSDGFLSGTRIR
jgi:hypothetical protein